MIAAAPELFRIREMPDQSYRRAGEVLAKYVDQAFSSLDAIVLLMADDDPEVRRLFAVDSAPATYSFSHPVTSRHLLAEPSTPPATGCPPARGRS
jgi:hypothetical protein